eukprot:701069-Pleurochrysis_carterae.AAC.1
MQSAGTYTRINAFTSRRPFEQTEELNIAFHPNDVLLYHPPFARPEEQTLYMHICQNMGSLLVARAFTVQRRPPEAPPNMPEVCVTAGGVESVDITEEDQTQRTQTFSQATGRGAEQARGCRHRQIFR